MMVLVEHTLKATAILGIALAALPFLRNRSAAYRHGVLSAAMIAVLALPVLSAVTPAWTPEWTTGRTSEHAGVAAAILPVSSAGATTAAVPASATAPQPRAETLQAVWLVGVFAGLLVLATGLARLTRMARAAHPVADDRWTRLVDRIAIHYRLRRRVRLLQSRNASILVTWGVLRPILMLPAGAGAWPDERAIVVLRHELAHIRRQDWLVQIVAQIVRIVYWFNPIVWLACRRLRLESERACDDAVLASGMSGPDYAAHLLDLAHVLNKPQRAWSAALAMARPSTTERRFAAMLNPALNRTALTARALAVTVVAALAITVPLAALRAGAQAGPLPLTGVVYDGTGAVVQSVEVALEDAQKVKRTATTDASGRFTFPSVAPGRYVLSAGVPGFKPLRHEFEVRATPDWERAITLQIGDIRETIVVREKRVTGTRVPAAGTATAPVRVGGNIRPPRKLAHVNPAYPPAMRDLGVEGIVPMEALIGRDGSVVMARVVTAQVHPEFAKAAVEAVRQWRFEPTLLNGEAVEVLMTVSVRFDLED